MTLVLQSLLHCGRRLSYLVQPNVWPTYVQRGRLTHSNWSGSSVITDLLKSSLDLFIHPSIYLSSLILHSKVQESIPSVLVSSRVTSHISHQFTGLTPLRFICTQFKVISTCKLSAKTLPPGLHSPGPGTYQKKIQVLLKIELHYTRS